MNGGMKIPLNSRRGLRLRPEATSPRLFLSHPILPKRPKTINRFPIFRAIRGDFARDYVIWMTDGKSFNHDAAFPRVFRTARFHLAQKLNRNQMVRSSI